MLTLLLAIVAPPAHAVEVHQVAYPWAENLAAYHDTSTLTPIAALTIARGEQVHLAYRISGTHSSAFTFQVEKTNTLGLPDAAIDVRLVEYIDVIDVSKNNSGLVWDDSDSDGYADRADWEALFPYASGNPSNPNSWYETWVDADSDTDSNYDAKLFRRAEPLPLLKTEGTGLDAIAVPAGESRLIWVTVTIPDNQATGDYSGTFLKIVATGGEGYKNIPLDVAVPCWDTLEMGNEQPVTWDYSYEPGAANGEVEGINPRSGDVEDARADLRMLARHTGIYWPIGIGSRSSAGATTTTSAWSDLVESFQEDFVRYESLTNASSTPSTPPTIVLGMGTLFKADWGSDPTEPDSDWSLRYGHMLQDLEAELYDWSIPLHEINWVMLPIDEPVERDKDSDGTYASEERLKAKPLSGGGLPAGMTRVSYLRGAANSIRDFTPSHGMNLKVGITHTVGTHATSTRSFLVDNLEDCDPAPGTQDCIDIWIRNHWGNRDEIGYWQDHLLEGVLDDEFWWYGNMNKIPINDFAVSGWHMYNHGITGSSSWAFSSANNYNGGADEFWYTGKPDPPIRGPWMDISLLGLPYTTHTWTSTRVDREPMFNQFAQAYLTDPARDATVPSSVPQNGELLAPGRFFFARRQSNEYYKLMWLLHDSGFNPAYEDDLQALIDDATDECHNVGLCLPGSASSEDVSFVIHSWLSQNFSTCAGSPSNPTYTGGKTVVEDALDLEVW